MLQFNHGNIDTLINRYSSDSRTSDIMVEIRNEFLKAGLIIGEVYVKSESEKNKTANNKG